MTIDNQGASGEERRRAQARATGAEAERIDPQAAADNVAEGGDPAAADVARDADDGDEAVRLVTATVEPGRDAPSRAGITGEGSGADGM